MDFQFFNADGQEQQIPEPTQYLNFAREEKYFQETPHPGVYDQDIDMSTTRYFEFGDLAFTVDEGINMVPEIPGQEASGSGSSNGEGTSNTQNQKERTVPVETMKENRSATPT